MHKQPTRPLETHDSDVDVICLMGFMSFVHTTKRVLPQLLRESEPTMTPGRLREVLNTRSRHGMTPLIAAIKAGSRGMVELLLQHGVSASIYDLHGVPPLKHAVQSGRANLVDFLLASRNANPDERGTTLESPTVSARNLVLDYGGGTARKRIFESLI